MLNVHQLYRAIYKTAFVRDWESTGTSISMGCVVAGLFPAS
jgi:hypothetical protein